MLHTLWGQIGFWIAQAIIGLIVSCLLFGQLAEEAHVDNRRDDEFRYDGIACKAIGTIIFGAILAASAAPGFFWGGNWIYATLAPAALAIIFQLVANENRAVPLAVLEFGAAVGGIALTGATIIPFALSRAAIVILVVTAVAIIATFILGAFAEREVAVWKRVVVVVAAAVIVAIFATVALGQPKPPAAQAAPTTSGTVAVSDADKAKLAAQVKITDDDVLRVKTDYVKKWGTAYLDSSMPWRAKDRKFSDAVSLPFTKNDVNGAWEELRKEVFLNPVHRYMVLKELSEVSWITQDNPWIQEFLKAYDSHGALYFTKDAEFKSQTDESIIWGIKSVLLLEKFKAINIVELPSTKNWHLNSAAEPSKVKPEINKEYQEDKPVLRIAFVWKDDQRILQYGFNMLDKRLEILGEKKKEEKKQDTPAPTPNPSTPGTPSTPDEPGGKEPTPEPEPEPTPTPTPEPEPAPKDPDDDPVNNGNADRGGGQNQPSDGSGPAEVQDPATVPTQGHQDPATTYPETPAQDSSHADTHVDNTNETPMNYESKPDPAQTWTNPDTGQSTTYTAPPAGQSSTKGSTAHGEFTPDI